MNNASRRTKCVWLLVVGFALVAVLVLVLLQSQRRQSVVDLAHDDPNRPLGSNKISKCKDNLFSIQIFKAEWASERNKSTNDVPTWNELRPYFEEKWSNGIPVCPDGGSYTLNRVGEQPTCSIGGRRHSLAR
jgi:hypothetical protein